MITLADITEEEFRVLELIEAERQEQIRSGFLGQAGGRPVSVSRLIAHPLTEAIEDDDLMTNRRR